MNQFPREQRGLSERDKAARLLGNFQYEGSRGDQFVQSLCPREQLTLDALKIIAWMCSEATGISFTKQYQRQKALVYLWLTEHYDSIAPLSGIVKVWTRSLEP
jgi:hypothetical protein